MYNAKRLPIFPIKLVSTDHLSVMQVSKVWTEVWASARPPKHQQLYWKILHDCLYNRLIIHSRINASVSPSCYFCPNDDTTCHYFFNCLNTSIPFWRKVHDFISQHIDPLFTANPTFEDIALFYPDYFIHRKHYKWISIIHSTALWSLWRCKLDAIYHSNQWNLTSLWDIFLASLADHLTVLHRAGNLDNQRILLSLWCRPHLAFMDAYGRIQFF
jgi:hypothetical protein